MGSLGSWALHLPRMVLAHLIAHVALLVQFVSLALDGLADGLLDLGRAVIGDVIDDDDDQPQADDDDLRMA